MFKALVDSKVIRNYISPRTVKRLGLLCKQKKDLYPLVIISGDPIVYKDRMIYFKTGPVELKLKGKYIIMSFNMLLLRKNKIILEMLFLQKYNLRID